MRMGLWVVKYKEKIVQIIKSTIGCIIKFFFLTYLEFFLGNVDFSVIHEG